jgi:nicotinamide riboside kinase
MASPDKVAEKHYSRIVAAMQSESFGKSWKIKDMEFRPRNAAVHK